MKKKYFRIMTLCVAVAMALLCTITSFADNNTYSVQKLDLMRMGATIEGIQWKETLVGTDYGVANKYDFSKPIDQWDQGTTFTSSQRYIERYEPLQLDTNCLDSQSTGYTCIHQEGSFRNIYENYSTAYLQVDLKGYYDISKINLNFSDGSKYEPSGYKIYVSNDPQLNSLTWFLNWNITRHDNSNTIRGRYVLIKMFGSKVPFDDTDVHLKEIEIFARAA